MARPPKGKPLTMRTVRLDDDVWAECQRLGKQYGTINEGMAVAHAALKILEADGWQPMSTQAGDLLIATVKPLPPSSRASTRTRKRGPRPKGDRTR